MDMDKCAIVREEVTVDSLINECNWKAHKADAEISYWRGQVEAFSYIKCKLELLKEDMGVE